MMLYWLHPSSSPDKPSVLINLNRSLMEPGFCQVVLNTSCGDIEIELWSKEAPLACRNFIQLAMEVCFVFRFPLKSSVQ
jgi:hypothetical protein